MAQGEEAWEPPGAGHELLMMDQGFKVWGVEGDKEQLARTAGVNISSDLSS